MNAKERFNCAEEIEQHIRTAARLVSDISIAGELRFALDHLAELKAVLYQDAIDYVRLTR